MKTKGSKGITVIELFVIIATVILVVTIVFSQIISAKKRGQIAVIEKGYEKFNTELELTRSEFGGDYSKAKIFGDTLEECISEVTAFGGARKSFIQMVENSGGKINCIISPKAWAFSFDTSFIARDKKEYTESTACFDSTGYKVIGVDLPGAYRWDESINTLTVKCIAPYAK